MKISVIHGPNLNLLGSRDPEIYGHKTLDEIENFLICSFPNCKFDFFQSNHEGEIIDKIQSLQNNFDALLINAGAFTHYSYAIRDALEIVNFPAIEVHLSDIKNREPFRKISVFENIVKAQFFGKQEVSYKEAIDYLMDL